MRTYKLFVFVYQIEQTFYFDFVLSNYLYRRCWKSPPCISRQTSRRLVMDLDAIWMVPDAFSNLLRSLVLNFSISTFLIEFALVTKFVLSYKQRQTEHTCIWMFFIVFRCIIGSSSGSCMFCTTLYIINIIIGPKRNWKQIIVRFVMLYVITRTKGKLVKGVLNL